MEKIVMLNPSKVMAYRLPNGKVMVTATGHEDGYCKIHIQSTPVEIIPPIYAVYGTQCAIPGYFPYTISVVIDYPTDKNTLAFQTTHGQLNVSIAPGNTEDLKAMTDLENTVGNNQVIGYAHNSINYQTAFADAVSQLQQKAPGQIKAKVVSSGFVGGSTHVGPTFTYIIMENAY